MKLHLMVLQGQGDTIVSLLNVEHYQWILSRETPGRKSKESSWSDTACPPDLFKAIKADDPDIEDEGVPVTIGSYQNDRAMYSYGVAEYTGDSVTEAVQWAKANGHELADGEYHGCIY